MSGRENFVTVPSPEGHTLHAQCYVREGSDSAVVICHAHPLYGASMNGYVEEMMYHDFKRRGYSVVRFNFRGVQPSTGVHGNMEGEVIDVNVMCEYIKAETGCSRLLLVGYSFGSVAAFLAAAQRDDIAGVVLIGYPLSLYHPTYTDALLSLACPKLFIIGDGDDVALGDECAWGVFQTFVDESVCEPKSVERIEGAGHFFQEISPANITEPLGRWLEGLKG
ncbi:unnamed protein product [Vitrella brassicaformis CCMP3155]|uniref:AB hydrolase-1 domain-containing protein n=1 Tax=Vitrella brassicaformis (strain CCMP3155) TaxID=1169540 RepID=A0A0G4EXK3_VITBC|nr:unnamed protein product [Vitrella brassicaformis CCMP3155]|mmetsp:Transcript_14671/g.34975  ORF Transcript_14671/g.34975 Transcript_14671/m.34975 type:complete len:222 (-) Transcript_14671:243-908(-)|eukprot:CEM03548.1 unnamed protein product [Vitrella brassicaformis CCMP3155]